MGTAGAWPAHTSGPPRSPGRHPHSLGNRNYTAVFAVCRKSLQALLHSSIHSSKPHHWGFFLTNTCSVKCLVVSAMRERGAFSALVGSRLLCHSHATKGAPWQGHCGRSGQHRTGLEWSVEVRAGEEGSAESGSQTRLGSEGLARVLLGPGASMWQCPHS